LDVIDPPELRKQVAPLRFIILILIIELEIHSPGAAIFQKQLDPE
jgi:hypothetical protein